MKRIFTISALTVLSLLTPILATAQTSAFTYQGKLTEASLPANGTYDFQFRLFDFTVAVAPAVTVDDVTVTDGIFTVQLDFGADAFPGADRFLEINVRPGSSTGAYTTLSPKQKITSAPMAIKSLSSGKALYADLLSDACAPCVTDAHIQAVDGTKVTGTVANAATANNVSGIVAVANGGTGSSTKNFVDLSTNQTVNGNKTFTGVVSGNGSGLTNLNGANLAAGSVTSSQLSPEAVPNSTAFKLLGSLRWDILKPRANFAVGISPQAIAFDGANIWVANNGSGNITKIRASDNVNLGAFSVGGNPVSLAFDGANIWVSNSGGFVTKLRASDGTNLGTFVVGGSPTGIAFDGANIWIVNAPVNRVTKIRASDGAPLGNFAVQKEPSRIAFDGTHMWITNFASDSVTQLMASNGDFLGHYPVGVGPGGVAFDGVNIWVANYFESSVTKKRASDGANLGTFPVGFGPQEIAFDGSNIWISNKLDHSIRKMRTSDGVVVGTFYGGSEPRGIAFDGTNIWVTSTTDNIVTRLAPAFPQP